MEPKEPANGQLRAEDPRVADGSYDSRSRVLSGVDLQTSWVVGIAFSVILALIMPTQGHAGGWCGFQHPGYPCASGATSFYVGYFSDPTGLDISFQSRTPSNNSLNQLSHKVDFQGVWFELLAPIKSAGPLGLVLGAFYHFPSRRFSQETISTGGRSGVNRTWDAAPQWGGFQVALTYEIKPALTALVGFKYESLLVNFSRARPVINPNDIFDRADMSINEYIPYFGFAYKRVQPNSGLELELALIGFPTLLGTVDFTETVTAGLTIGGVSVPAFPASQAFQNGGFLEWYTEVSFPVRDCFRLGSFVRYNVAQASAQVNVGERNATIPRVDYDFNFDRRVWSVGGVVAFSF